MGVSDCLPLNENSLDHEVRWRGGATAPSEDVEVVVRLTDAEVFSLW
jgi:hypothetical protein